MMKRSLAQTVALVGMLSALTATLSFLEGWLPSVGIPGVRLGLANLAVTAALYWLGAVGGAGVATVKVLFVMMTRGVTAAMLSAAGTAAAVIVTMLLLPLYRRQRMSFVGIGVAASTAHTIGQLLTVSLFLTSAVAVYAPLLLLLTIPSGCVTGWILNGLIPRLTPLVGRSIEKG